MPSKNATRAEKLRAKLEDAHTAAGLAAAIVESADQEKATNWILCGGKAVESLTNSTTAFIAAKMLGAALVLAQEREQAVVLEAICIIARDFAGQMRPHFPEAKPLNSDEPGEAATLASMAPAGQA